MLSQFPEYCLWHTLPLQACQHYQEFCLLYVTEGTLSNLALLHIPVWLYWPHFFSKIIFPAHIHSDESRSLSETILFYNVTQFMLRFSGQMWVILKPYGQLSYYNKMIKAIKVPIQGMSQKHWRSHSIHETYDYKFPMIE